MAPSTDTVIHAKLACQGCAAELRLNGLPLLYFERSKAVNGAIAAHEYLVPGSNRIELWVEPGAKPSLADAKHRVSLADDAWARVKLVRYPAGVFADDENGEVLVEINWRASDEKLERDREKAETFPKILIRDIAVDIGSWRWSWLDAPPLTMDDVLLTETRMVMDRVIKAFRSGDLGALWSVTEVCIRDVFRAYPAIEEESFRKDLGEFLEYYRKGPDADPVFPIQPDRHDFRLVAGGKVLQCVDDDFQPSIRLRSPEDGSPVPYPLLLARINGRLEVVR